MHKVLLVLKVLLVQVLKVLLDLQVHRVLKDIKVRQVVAVAVEEQVLL